MSNVALLPLIQAIGSIGPGEGLAFSYSFTAADGVTPLPLTGIAFTLAINTLAGENMFLGSTANGVLEISGDASSVLSCAVSSGVVGAWPTGAYRMTLIATDSVATKGIFVESLLVVGPTQIWSLTTIMPSGSTLTGVAMNPQIVVVTASQTISKAAIYIVTVAGVTLTLNPPSSVNGPVTIKDVTGNADPNIAIVGAIDGASSMALHTAYQSVTLQPLAARSIWGNVADAPAGTASGTLTGFTSALNTAAPNATTNVSSLTASGGTTDQSIALVPKGNGGFSLQIPDGVAMNPVGVGAADFQLSRSDPAQVASGAFSVAFGQNNTASGDYSFVFGDANIASGVASFAGGGADSGCIASNDWSFAFGDAAISSGYAAVAIGDIVTADGSWSNARGTSSTTRGISIADVYGSDILPVKQGSFQRGHYIVGGITTDGSTVVVLMSNPPEESPSAINQLALPNGQNGALGAAYVFSGQIVAVDPATGNRATWNFMGSIGQAATAASTVLDRVSSNAGGVAWTLANPIPPNFINATWSGGTPPTVTLSADTTNGALAITVVGIAATTIQWMCDILTSETTY